jgi:hypothetical protein
MKHLIRISLIALYMVCNTSELVAVNKIIYLISPPRSLSVAFLRMMQARGDFEVMHEPSQCAWAVSAAPDLAEILFKKDVFQTYSEVKRCIFEKAQQRPVFVKEMSFAVQEFIMQDRELVENPQVHFVFLVRNPHHSTISFYNRLQKVADDLAYVIGYQALFEIYSDVQARSVHKPVIILSEDLYTKPRETIEQFCKAVDIPFKEEALSWQDLGEHFTGDKEWSEIKHKNFTQHWHGDAIRSTAFGKPTEYEVDADGKPTFDEVAPEHRQAFQDAYEVNLAYYNKLLECK